MINLYQNLLLAAIVLVTVGIELHASNSNDSSSKSERSLYSSESESEDFPTRCQRIHTFDPDDFLIL